MGGPATGGQCVQREVSGLHNWMDIHGQRITVEGARLVDKMMNFFFNWSHLIIL